MIDTLNTSLIFDSAKALGLSEIVLTVEKMDKKIYQRQNRSDTFHIERKERFQFHAKKEDETIYFESPNANLSPLLNFLKITLEPNKEEPVIIPTQNIFFSPSIPKGFLAQFLFKFFDTKESSFNPHLYLEVQNRYIQIITEDSRTTHLKDSFNSITLNWRDSIKSELQETTFYFQDLNQLLNLDSSLVKKIFQKVKRSNDTHNFWPAPFGNIPLLWSADCVSKLLYTYYKERDPDCESQLEYEIKKENLREGEINLTLLPTKPLKKLELEWGIHIEDLEVLKAPLDEEEAVIKLSPLFLVHQGSKGERIEDVILSMNFNHLLKEFKWFSDAPEQNYLIDKLPSKANQYKITTPAVVSDKINLPGTVPQENYW